MRDLWNGKPLPYISAPAKPPTPEEVRQVETRQVTLGDGPQVAAGDAVFDNFNWVQYMEQAVQRAFDVRQADVAATVVASGDLHIERIEVSNEAPLGAIIRGPRHYAIEINGTFVGTGFTPTNG